VILTSRLAVLLYFTLTLLFVRLFRLAFARLRPGGLGKLKSALRPETAALTPGPETALAALASASVAAALAALAAAVSALTSVTATLAAVSALTALAPVSAALTALAAAVAALTALAAVSALTLASIYAALTALTAAVSALALASIATLTALAAAVSALAPVAAALSAMLSLNSLCIRAALHPVRRLPRRLLRVVRRGFFTRARIRFFLAGACLKTVSFRVYANLTADLNRAVGVLRFTAFRSRRRSRF
jgi:hypothetical protein